MKSQKAYIRQEDKGWYVLAGCSHPSVQKVLDESRQYGNVIGLIGGMHSFDSFTLLEDLDLVCACHCTKHKKKIQQLYPEISVDGGVGKILEI